MNAVTGLKVLGSVALGLLLVSNAPGKESQGKLSTEELLFIVPTISPWSLYDMHGNADDVLQELMIRRFDATAAICKQLERTDLRDEYIGALFDVLSFVKDPAAIPWLEKQWRENPVRMSEMWLERHWSRRLRGASERELKWLTGVDEWAAFFRRRAADEPALEHRIKLLRVLAAWFHDTKTIEFFADLEKASQGGEPLLIAQVYLLQHKREFDQQRTAQVLDELSRSPANTELLLEYAEELRHEAFVPWLVSIVGPANDEVNVGDAQWTLEQITFCRDIKGQEQWQKWYKAHGAEDRKAWIAQAMAEFNAVLKRNPAKAKAIWKEAVYRWDDRALLPYVKELLPNKKLHNELVGWINLSYHPYWRNELQEVAGWIISTSAKDLEKWAVNLLKGRQFLPSKEDTWSEWVHGSNRAI